jgi:hypothetical protein
MAEPHEERAGVASQRQLRLGRNDAGVE